MKILSRLSVYRKLIIGFGLINLLLTACGGGNGSSSSSSSSTSSIASSHIFSSTPVTPPLDGTWPNVKVSAVGTKALKFEWTAAANTDHYKLFKKADAASAYVQVGSNFTALSVTDAVSVHLTDWVNMRYKVQACTAADVCSDSTEIVANSAMLTAITYVKASNTDANDWFGWSLAISADGSTMAVGAPGESSDAKGINGDQSKNNSPTSGAVYVFVKSAGEWTQQAYIKASNTEDAGSDTILQNPNDRFGYQVALSADGNHLAVTAINEDSPSIGINCSQNDYLTSSSTSSGGTVYSHVQVNYGAVYVFERSLFGSTATWTQQAYIKPMYIEYNASLTFGKTLAFSGDGKTLAIGTDNQGVFSDKLAGIFPAHTSSDSSSASSCVDFTSSVPASSSTSSSSLSSSSSSSSVASSTSSSSSSALGGVGSGAVYVYVLTTNGWEADAFIKASDLGQYGSFGAAIALSNDGSWLAVGATGETYTPASSVASSAASSSSVTLNPSAGTVYIFNKSNGNWAETSKIFAKVPRTSSVFGASLSLSADGTLLAIGAPLENSIGSGIDPDPTLGDGSDWGTGACYVFKQTSGSWAQEAFIKPSNPHAGFGFGGNLSLSADGSVLAVGSPFERSQATGINGDQQDQAIEDAGAVYVFLRTSSGVWSQKSYVKAPLTHKFDRFGHALGLDSTGQTLVVGSYREPSKATGINGDKTNSSAPAAGAVFIY